MKTHIAIALLCPCLLLSFASQASAADKMATVEVSMDVPDPGWKIRIVDMYEKEGKLLVVCEAKHPGAISPQVISRVKDSADIGKKYAKLPREILLLGCKWNWGKGYKAVTWKEMEKHTAGAKRLNPVFTAKKVQDVDFVGMTLERAEDLAVRSKVDYRIIMIDGKPRPTTRGHRPERFNFTVKKGRITKVTKG